MEPQLAARLASPLLNLLSEDLRMPSLLHKKHSCGLILAEELAVPSCARTRSPLPHATLISWGASVGKLHSGRQGKRCSQKTGNVDTLAASSENEGRSIDRYQILSSGELSLQVNELRYSWHFGYMSYSLEILHDIIANLR